MPGPDVPRGRGPGGPPAWAEGGPGWHGPHVRLPRAFTLWAPVLASFAVQVPSAVWIAASQGGSHAMLLLLVGIALVGPLALIAARRWPGPVVAITAVAASADVVVNQTGGPPYIALAFAIVGAIVRGARVWAWVSISVAWSASIIVALHFGGPRFEGPRLVATTLGILIVVGLAEGLRARRERYAEFRRRATEARQSELQAERVRIARELHDVLAHSLSQINVQAGVGLHLMQKQPEKAAEALASIKDTSKTALEEVRSVLGVLRAENGADPSAPLVPEPGLDRLGALTVPGVRVELDDRLDHADVPQPVQFAIYRIVQESLTNVGRHAAGASVARVALRRDDDGYRVAVRDDGHAAPASGVAAESGGRGVLGMRERAELLGGRLTAGPAAGGGFEVVAELPARIGAPS
ncbi:sensor histidine kinase [Pseudolysinimonas sp.]|uniref:sensor histidine kinase n=1 Tax=Pseudolysinimonas sp. TaxID=2680009 RepID=UPI003F7EE890